MIVKVHNEDKDKPCCGCGATLNRLKNVRINDLYYLSVGGNKMFICKNCLISLYGQIGYTLGTNPF